MTEHIKAIPATIHREACELMREACAKIVETDTRSEIAKEWGYIPTWFGHCIVLAAKIRALEIPPLPACDDLGNTRAALSSTSPSSVDAGGDQLRAAVEAISPIVRGMVDPNSKDDFDFWVLACATTLAKRALASSAPSKDAAGTDAVERVIAIIRGPLTDGTPSYIDSKTADKLARAIVEDREDCTRAAATPTPPPAATVEQEAREARFHAVQLEHCHLMVESEPIAKAMVDAAKFLREYYAALLKPAAVDTARDGVWNEAIEASAAKAKTLHRWSGSADLINGLDRDYFSASILSLRKPTPSIGEAGE